MFKRIAEEVIFEGWGADSQRADVKKHQEQWKALLDKHKDDPKKSAALKRYQANNWKASYAEREIADKK